MRGDSREFRSVSWISGGFRSTSGDSKGLNTIQGMSGSEILEMFHGPLGCFRKYQRVSKGLKKFKGVSGVFQGISGTDLDMHKLSKYFKCWNFIL